MNRPIEHSAVAIRYDLPEFGLHAGDVGVVVHVYPTEAVEVEFMDREGYTVALLTMLDVDLRPPTEHERKHNSIESLPEGVSAPMADATHPDRVRT